MDRAQAASGRLLASLRGYSAPGGKPAECLICTSSIPSREAWYRFPCGHVHCENCLLANFRVSIKTMPFQPVRCCQPIDTALLRHCVMSTELSTYRDKLAEWKGIGDMVYCFDPKCSAFIPPALRSPKQNVAKCRKCYAKTCMECRGRFHFGKCPVDSVAVVVGLNAEEAERRRQWRREQRLAIANERFRNLTKTMGWKHCPRCQRTVEKTDGCNHIVCICGCHFCYRCGKTPYGNHGRCAM
ncbi:hypothetical protein B0H66DRAFT_62607 [Apodospora peruviana]|uniref:RBR-type E3 ubiquitin transferase n=1 Tax=Apodospora peruviana TaxID=516989 RepID=A0AAE0ISL5_9PEZI|nr:hypothetical protein B0H66DRAFT_62607 [Apodospora peruviana]